MRIKIGLSNKLFYVIKNYIKLYIKTSKSYAKCFSSFHESSYVNITLILFLFIDLPKISSEQDKMKIKMIGINYDAKTRKYKKYNRK